LEEPVNAIVERYHKYNAHAKGYVWKHNEKVLDLGATLAENGLVDERKEMETIGINEKDWLPALFLYYADDLSIE
jgi:hypothetical protein